METIIISLGGSLIVPDAIDTAFLKDFKELILSHVSQGKRFVIITGGGKICRRYQDAANSITTASTLDMDWIGIAALKLNAELVRVIFRDNAHPEVVPEITSEINFDKPILIGSAYKPGRSSDWDAVAAAKAVGAKKVINLSNTDYVYESDPRTNPNAKKIEQISWADFRKIIPSEWTHSGMNVPFDPVASELAEEEGIQVAIMNGKPIDNLAKYLSGEKFLGTIIS